ncbi:MAG TPA: hypothetical protein VLF66_16785, partial [Thermoanaerobaculia bacterium]|nr:hypothetical protein [Thermoanaerobaculia bacterium]
MSCTLNLGYLSFALAFAISASGRPGTLSPDAVQDVISPLSERAAHGTCAQPLSRADILDVVLRVLELPSERSLLEIYEIDIQSQDCDYLFSAARRDLAAVEPVSLVIDRSGRVINPP